MGTVVVFPHKNIQQENIEHDDGQREWRHDDSQCDSRLRAIRNAFNHLPCCQRRAIVRLSLLCSAFAAMPAVVFLGYIIFFLANTTACPPLLICREDPDDFLFIATPVYFMAGLVLLNIVAAAGLAGHWLYRTTRTALGYKQPTRMSQ